MNNENHVLIIDTFFAEGSVTDFSKFTITQTTGIVTASNDLNKWNGASHQQITLILVSLGLAMMTVFTIASIVICFMCRNARLVHGDSIHIFL